MNGLVGVGPLLVGGVGPVRPCSRHVEIYRTDLRQICRDG